MDKAKILYVEDDETLGYLTTDNLQLRGYEVDHCKDGLEALLLFKSKRHDICLLDIMLPTMDGFELAKEIRSFNQDIPILFLTAKILADDKIKGFKTGGDDYIVKPFNIEELVLKINVFLKRSKISNNYAGDYTFSEGRFNHHQLELVIKGQTQILTQKEADLLKFFIDHQGEVLKRDFILNSLWGDDDYFMGRSLDVFISRLRKYLLETDKIKIENFHGVGFKMVVNH